MYKMCYMSLKHVLILCEIILLLHVLLFLLLLLHVFAFLMKFPLYYSKFYSSVFRNNSGGNYLYIVTIYLINNYHPTIPAYCRLTER